MVVEQEQTLAVLETDKASMDMPSSAAGIVKAVHISVGDKVSEGALVVTVEASESAAVASEEVIGVEDVQIDLAQKAETPAEVAPAYQCKYS